MSSGEDSYITFWDQETEERRANAYYKPNLLGGSVSFKFDAKQQDCSCIGQVSLLAMPAVSADGKVDGESDTHFACDARGMSGGELCPEFTLFEGNMHGFRTTPRACTEPTSVNGGAHFTECDAEGDLGFDVHDQTEFTYGPGGDIDTN